MPDITTFDVPMEIKCGETFDLRLVCTVESAGDATLTINAGLRIEAEDLSLEDGANSKTLRVTVSDPENRTADVEAELSIKVGDAATGTAQDDVSRRIKH